MSLFFVSQTTNNSSLNPRQSDSFILFSIGGANFMLPRRANLPCYGPASRNTIAWVTPLPKVCDVVYELDLEEILFCDKSLCGKMIMQNLV